MRKRPNSTLNSSGVYRVGANRAEPNVVLESHLSRVLLSIATLLIGSGYAYGRMSKLAREAFVEAAASVLRSEHRKVNIARIAASTGLTRLEVSKIVRRSNRMPIRERVAWSRPANVAAGWIADKDFINSKKRPRPLLFKGGQYDFAALVKRYSGDIPVRAMLVEMRRLGMVSQDAQGVIRLIRPAIKVSREAISALRAVSPWFGLLEESVHAAPHGDLSSHTHKIHLHFDSIPQVNAVMRLLRKRRVAFVQGLSELGTRTEKSGKISLRINVGIAVAKPIRTRAKPNNQTPTRG
jgi:hypothetical protein